MWMSCLFTGGEIARENQMPARVQIGSQKQKNLRFVKEAEVCIKNNNKTMMFNVVG